MKKALRPFACLLSLALLAACNQGNNVQTGEASTTEASTEVSTNNPNVFIVFTSDKKLSLDLPNSDFTDEFPNKETFAKTYLPEMDASKLTLIQTDSNAGMIIYAQNLGAISKEDTTYLTQVEDKLKKDKEIAELAVDSSINNQLSYQFSHKVGEDVVRENCLINQGDEAYLVCASNTNGEFADLNNIIKSVKINSANPS